MADNKNPFTPKYNTTYMNDCYITTIVNPYESMIALEHGVIKSFFTYHKCFKDGSTKTETLLNSDGDIYTYTSNTILHPNGYTIYTNTNYIKGISRYIRPIYYKLYNVLRKRKPFR